MDGYREETIAPLLAFWQFCFQKIFSEVFEYG